MENIYDQPNVELRKNHILHKDLECLEPQVKSYYLFKMRMRSEDLCPHSVIT